MDSDDLMDFAARPARRAGEVTLEHFGRVAVEFKADRSEVTAADRASEELVRSTIAERFPEDGVFGEEGTSVAGRSGRRWIVDPIDGTRSFASGVPLYGVLLALEVEGAPVLGCAHFPAVGQTVVAARGAGAWVDGRPARVSEVDDLSQARISTSGMEYWRDWATAEGKAGLERLHASSRYLRTWGDCYGYVMVATGRAEIMVDPSIGSYWDYAALLPILSEAGASFTTIGGGEVGTWRSALASNGRLHERAAAFWDARERGDAAVLLPELIARQAGG